MLIMHILQVRTCVFDLQGPLYVRTEVQCCLLTRDGDRRMLRHTSIWLDLVVFQSDILKLGLERVW
jgi:hypothetical protein